MTSEEKLIATAAKELLEASSAIDLTGTVRLGTDEEDLEMPCTVVTVKFASEEPGSTLPKEYSLEVEQRRIAKVHDEEALDTAWKAIGAALTGSVPTPTPPTLVSAFEYFRIENQAGSDHTPGDTSTRTRSYRVFASFL